MKIPTDRSHLFIFAGVDECSQLLSGRLLASLLIQMFAIIVQTCKMTARRTVHKGIVDHHAKWYTIKQSKPNSAGSKKQERRGGVFTEPLFHAKNPISSLPVSLLSVLVQNRKNCLKRNRVILKFLIQYCTTSMISQTWSQLRRQIRFCRFPAIRTHISR